MNIILVGTALAKPRRIALTAGQLGVVAAGVVLLIAAVGAAGGYVLGSEFGAPSAEARAALLDLQDEISQQATIVAQTDEYSRRHLDALSTRLADLQARATRLDALGQRLTEVGQLEGGEFDFSGAVAVGGPEEPSDVTPNIEDTFASVAQLESKLGDQELQLTLLADLLTHSELVESLMPAGRPIRSGWISSRYGKRADPFTGRPAVHTGVDFSGAPGSDILAVAGGVVTWAGKRYGYGLMVEIDHGNGYATRYAHNQENLVEVGQRVSAGDVIALLGSTGRSTSPHVHLEVFKGGKRVDPMSFVKKTRQPVG